MSLTRQAVSYYRTYLVGDLATHKDKSALRTIFRYRRKEVINGLSDHITT